MRFQLDKQGMSAVTSLLNTEVERRIEECRSEMVNTCPAWYNEHFADSAEFTAAMKGCWDVKGPGEHFAYDIGFLAGLDRSVALIRKSRDFVGDSDIAGIAGSLQTMQTDFIDKQYRFYTGVFFSLSFSGRDDFELSLRSSRNRKDAPPEERMAFNIGVVEGLVAAEVHIKTQNGVDHTEECAMSLAR